ncbi:MAG: glycosyltransferase, partial [Bacteroidota bacterium]
QLYLQAPNRFTKWVEPILFYFHLKFLKRFSKIWIPDAENENNLSGILSHHPSIQKNLICEFIGPLSRFKRSTDTTTTINYEVVVLISGPEPQRSIFQEACVKEAKRIKKKTLILLGLPNKKEMTTNGNITLASHLDHRQLSSTLINAKYIVCRSGYSTLMDLAALNKTALCIPTPGQTEQLYLAEHLSKQHKIVFQEQHSMNWEIGFTHLSEVSGLSFSSDDLLDQSLNNLSF